MFRYVIWEPEDNLFWCLLADGTQLYCDTEQIKTLPQEVMVMKFMKEEKAQKIINDRKLGKSRIEKILIF